VAARQLPGLGPDTLIPKLQPRALAGLQIGAEEGFVLSRVDGRTSIGQIMLLVPFDVERTVAIVQRLRALGAIELAGAEPLPNEPSAPAKMPMAPLPQPPPAKVTAPPPTVPASTTNAAPPATISGLDITVEQARRIEEYFATLGTRDAWALLGLTPGADKKEIKRAYFKLSKEFHPDRYFGRNIGPYKDQLNRIFQTIKSAFEELS
jgi:hypothetical protein